MPGGVRHGVFTPAGKLSPTEASGQTRDVEVIQVAAQSQDRAEFIRPLDFVFGIWSKVPTSSSGRRPALSTKAMATKVKARLINPIQTDEVKAALLPAPADAKILVE
jgi:hypothetical protein